MNLILEYVERGLFMASNRKKCMIDYEKKVKECSTCGEIKDFDKFYKNAKMTSGLFAECKECAQAKKDARTPKKPKKIDYENELKNCPSCNQMLPFSEFFKDSRSKTGVQSYCKSCTRKKRGSEARVVSEVEEASQTKKCATCLESLSVDDFDMRTDTGRLRGSCKACRREKNGFSREGRQSVEVDYENQLKRCSKCKELVPFSDFYKAKNKFLGLQPACRFCNSKSTGHTPRKRMLLDTEKKIKQCRVCGEIKSFDEFNKDSKLKLGISAYCKACLKKKREEDIEKSRAISRKSEAKHRVKRNAKNRKYGRENRARLNEYMKNRMKSDINYRLTRLLRTRLANAVRGEYKAGSAISDLGCSIEELKTHLESKFYDHPITGEVMSWESYGFYGWHIDHIKPLASFDLTDREHAKQACHYTNLQPLWAEDNHRKGDREDYAHPARS